MGRTRPSQGTLASLRRRIAHIEGRLEETFQPPAAPAPNHASAKGPHAASAGLARPDSANGDPMHDDREDETVVLREDGMIRLAHPPGTPWPTGAIEFDDALGGGLVPGLVEIVGEETRHAGALCGLALALLLTARPVETDRQARQSFRRSTTPAPQDRPMRLLWIATDEMLREAGHPYPPGLLQGLGLPPGALLLARARKPADALWIAEEAAHLAEPVATLIEMRGAPAALDLTATRRLHRRARLGGRPLILLRQATHAAPTAAPLRLAAAPAASAPPRFAARPDRFHERGIGTAAFSVRIDRSRANPVAEGRVFQLRWHGGRIAAASEILPDPIALRGTH